MNTHLSPQNKLDWNKIKFEYLKCDYRFQANWKNGTWDNGELKTDENIVIHEGSTAIHYAQQCFEGMKAKMTSDGRILLFRPFLNWERMNETAKFLMIPEISKEFFISAIKKTIIANKDFIPPFETGASLYIRPLLIGVGPNIGVMSAKEFIFRVFVIPVSSYYNSKKINPLTLKISDIDRVPPNGIGCYKAGANYAGVLLAQKKANSEDNAEELLFLDPIYNKFIEEAGSANIIIYLNNKKLITPKSKSILPSITRKSAMEIAEKILKIKTECKPINFYEEVDQFVEVANCGTAAIISPVGKVIDNKGNIYKFYNEGNSIGPVMLKIRNILTSIQNGQMKDPFNWTYEITK